MEEGQTQPDPPRPPQEPKGGDQPSEPAPLQPPAPSEAPSEGSDQKEPPGDEEETGDSASQLQAKPLWKPIPPLLPESNMSENGRTRDQICQTDGSEGHNSGG